MSVGLFINLEVFTKQTNLDQSKLKVFVEKKVNAAIKLKYYLESVENIYGKGESGHQHVLLFPLCFQEASLSR